MHKDVWQQHAPSISSLSNTVPALVRDLGSPDFKFEETGLSLSAESCIGIGYVILGSSMGSQVILDKIGGRIPEHKQHFMKAMAEASVAFRQYCQEVESLTIPNQDEIVQGACDAFKYMAEFKRQAA